MNAFQLIDEIAKLGIEWDVTDWTKSIRKGQDDPLQVYVGGNLNFKDTVGKLLERGVSLSTINTVLKAYDGYLHREDKEIAKYRDYMLKSWKFTEEAKKSLKKGW